jgi:photosystem II stability/assembly factor-like uncharacterized protein
MRKTLMLIVCALLLASAQIPTVWSPRGIGGGGAQFAPSWSPHTAGEAYVGCDMGGLYHTTDGGVSWTLLPFYEIQGGNFTCVQFTENPSIMYCLSNNGNGYTPCRSTDNGVHWDSLTGDPTFGDAWSMFADPRDHQRVIVTDYSNLWLSTNGGASFGAPKYTSGSGGGCCMAGVFFDSADIYAGTNSGLLVSTNGGSTFSLQPLTGIAAGQGLLSFSGAKQSGTVRFTATTADTNDLYAGLQGSDYWNLCTGVYVKDGSGNWVLRTNGLNLANDFVFYTGMARDNINTAYLAGGSSSGAPVVFKTTNAGNNWSQVFLTTNNQNIYTGYCGYQGDYSWGWAECPMGFTVSPNDANRVMMTDYGFCHRTTDGGAMWYQSYVTPSTQNTPGAPTPKGRYYGSNGLEVTSVWWLTWSDSADIFGSYTDIRGARSTDGGWTWSFDYNGHAQNTMYQALRHPNGNLYAATSTVHDLYQSTYLQDARIDNGSGRVLYSTNMGEDWQLLHDFGHPVIFLALDSHHPNRMYASVVHHSLGGIFVSNDIQNGSGSTWTQLANPPRTQGHPFNIYVLEDSSLVCTYSGRRDGSGAFTPSSGVFLSTNNGASWLDRSDDGQHYWTKDIVIDPYDPAQNTWYTGVFSGWGGPPNNLGGLYRTTNRGVSWTRINDLLWVESCAFSPHDSNFIFMTTEGNGLWFSSNIRSASPAFNLVSNYSFGHPLRVFYNPHNLNEIWVTSFGNGLKAGDITTGISEFLTPGQPAGEITIYPNPFRDKTTIGIGQRAKSMELKIYDISGKLVKVLSLSTDYGLLSAVVWSGSDQAGRPLPAGVYFARFECGNFSSTQKIIKLR